MSNHLLDAQKLVFAEVVKKEIYHLKNINPTWYFGWDICGKVERKHYSHPGGQGSIKLNPLSTLTLSNLATFAKILRSYDSNPGQLGQLICKCKRYLCASV